MHDHSFSSDNSDHVGDDEIAAGEDPEFSPAGWPANQPPKQDAEWAKFRESDKKAGIEITKDFVRFSQKDTAFARVKWDQTYITEKHQRIINAESDPVIRKAKGFTQRDYALRNASFLPSRRYRYGNPDKDINEGGTDTLRPYREKSEQKAKLVSPDRTTAEIKEIAKLFGADLVGVTEFDERWIYSARFAPQSKKETVTTDLSGMTHVIVVGHAMDYELSRSYPSALAGTAAGTAYSEEITTIDQLTQYILDLGYDAVASMNDTALSIPYAVKAGLGEYGRNGMVITEELGPRVRFAKVFTNIPLTNDEPRKLGIVEFCNICRRCAESCPSRAIDFGPPTDEIPNQSNIVGVKKWQVDGAKCYDYWANMGTDCGICIRSCPFNKDFSKWYFRIAQRAAGTRLRRLVAWLDKRLGFGERLKPDDWWERNFKGNTQ